MNRWIVGLGVAFLLLVLVVWGWRSMRSAAAYKAPIHRQASAIIRIDADRLTTAIAWNALWNPSYYRDLVKDTPEIADERPWRKTGVQLPAHIFLYSIAHATVDLPKGLLFGSLPVSDSILATDFLKRNLGLEADGSNSKVLKSDRLLVQRNEQRIYFAVSQSTILAYSDQIATVLAELADPEHAQPLNQSPWRTVKKTKGDLVYLKDNPIVIRFGNGKINFYALYPDVHGGEELLEQPMFSGENTLSVWASEGGLRMFRGLQIRFGTHTMEVDSLIRYGAGAYQLEWAGLVSQMDSVTRFEFDDNFDMVEVVEVEEKEVPDLLLTMGGDTPGLMRYLQRVGALDSMTMQVDRSLLPWFDLRAVAGADGRLLLKTMGGKLQEHSATVVQSNTVFYAYLDWKKARLQLDMPEMIARFVASLTSLEAEAHRNGAKTTRLTGEVLLEEREIHGLVAALQPLWSQF